MTQQIPIESTLFPVKEIPAIFKRDDGQLKQHTGHKFIVREDNDSILSCMTDDYRMVTNSELIETALPILKDNGAVLQEAISFGEGQKTTWKWIIPDVKIEVDKDDYMNPEIIIKNSYDGSLQVHIMAGAFRVICSNGLVIGVVLGNKNYRHNNNNINLDNLDYAVEKTITHTRKVGEDFPSLKEKKLNEKHILGLVELFPSTMSEFMVDYLIANKPQNYWDLLNCATWIATHKMNRNYQATHKLESQIYPNISKWAKA
ncbi:MAG: DUF932 domain-containing protein [Pelagibacterales bacterium]|nr:DUF932 domain-containing protein [Pelagibacterales bacterium]